MNAIIRLGTLPYAAERHMIYRTPLPKLAYQPVDHAGLTVCFKSYAAIQPYALPCTSRYCNC